MGLGYNAAGSDFARTVASGSFTATGTSNPVLLSGDFNVSVWGTFVASITMERSFDAGVTWQTCTQGGYAITITAPLTTIANEPEGGVLYRLNCTRTSGTINWRLSQ